VRIKWCLQISRSFHRARRLTHPNVKQHWFGTRQVIRYELHCTTVETYYDAHVILLNRDAG